MSWERRYVSSLSCALSPLCMSQVSSLSQSEASCLAFTFSGTCTQFQAGLSAERNSYRVATGFYPALQSIKVELGRRHAHVLFAWAMSAALLFKACRLPQAALSINDSDCRSLLAWWPCLERDRVLCYLERRQ